MEKISTFAIRLTEALEGKSYTEVAQKIGLSKQAISAYTTGKRIPKRPTVVALAALLNVDFSWLCGFNVPRLPAAKENTSSLIGKYGILPTPRTVRKPRLGSIACGMPILSEQNLDGYDDIPENIHCDFTLICKGDSMIGARIHDGDVVYIRQQPEVENGQIAAVLIDGTDATLKRVYFSDGMVTLQAENPAYAPIVITEERQFSILGLAVGFTSIIK